MSNLNWLDKTKSFFNPAYGFKAARYRAAEKLFYGGLYDGAKQSAHYDIEVYDTNEDEDIADIQILRATSRAKYRNNGFYRGIMQAATDHVVGSGLKAKSTLQKRALSHLSDARIKEVEAMFDDYFNSWAKSTICDITGKDNFYLLQALAYNVYKKDGDSFASLPLTKIGSNRILQINLIGAELIKSNTIGFIEGIKVSKNKLPLIYSVEQADKTYKEIKAFSGGKRNMLHIFKRERVKQLRGIPFLAPVMRDVDAIDQYMKYELTAAKLAAIFFGSIQSKTKSDIFGNTTDLLSGEQTQTKKNTVKENSITQLAEGDELKIHQQGRDNPNYDKFILTSMQKVSSHTRIPLEIILTIFSSSYSASRASMLLMMKFVNPERMLFNNSFNTPVREQVLTWGILNGDLNVPDFFDYKSDYLSCIWTGDPMGSVDPQKDVKAKVMAIEARLGTHEQATTDLGNGDFETNVTILQKELDLLEPLKPKEGN